MQASHDGTAFPKYGRYHVRALALTPSFGWGVALHAHLLHSTRPFTHAFEVVYFLHPVSHLYRDSRDA